VLELVIDFLHDFLYVFCLFYLGAGYTINILWLINISYA